MATRTGEKLRGSSPSAESYALPCSLLEKISASRMSASARSNKPEAFKIRSAGSADDAGAAPAPLKEGDVIAKYSAWPT